MQCNVMVILKENGHLILNLKGNVIMQYVLCRRLFIGNLCAQRLMNCVRECCNIFNKVGLVKVCRKSVSDCNKGEKYWFYLELGQIRRNEMILIGFKDMFLWKNFKAYRFDLHFRPNFVLKPYFNRFWFKSAKMLLQSVMKC